MALKRAEAVEIILLQHLECLPNNTNGLLKNYTKLNNLNKEIVNYMVLAEKYAGHLPPNGIYEYSLLLETTGYTITYWKLVLSSLST